MDIRGIGVTAAQQHWLHLSMRRRDLYGNAAALAAGVDVAMGVDDLVQAVPTVDDVFQAALAVEASGELNFAGAGHEVIGATSFPDRRVWPLALISALKSAATWR